MTEKIKVEPQVLADFCQKEIEAKMGENIISIDARGQSSLADFFILCSATSGPHLHALASTLERQAREQLKIRPKSVNGTDDSGWILLDFGDVLVHLMTTEVRERYQLEALWQDPDFMLAESATEQARKQK